MLARGNTAVLAVITGALALATTACSSLTRSEEITISKDPAAVKAPTPGQIPAAPQPMGGMPAAQGG